MTGITIRGPSEPSQQNPAGVRDAFSVPGPNTLSTAAKIVWNRREIAIARDL